MNLSPEDLSAINKLLGREPTLTETHIFDVMWSEHCSYKSSKDVLKKYLPTKGSNVALGIGEDSGIIRFVKHNGTQYCIAVSHESHNHPSQILPVEGAATGVGGVVRDVYCMGADVVGVLDSLHFGIDKDGHNPLVEEIAEEVVNGVSDYANPLGVPVLGGETIYHSSYNDNCLVNVAALGLVEEDKIIHSYVPEQAKQIPYDIILFGKSTDATGFGGASFASATLDNENEASNVGAVQVHDPFLKRVMVEAIKQLLNCVNEEKIAIGFKDLGAGGIACATSEIAAASGFGVDVDLDQVNIAFDTLPPEIITCSETQERFCLAVPHTFSQKVLDIFNKEFELPSLYHGAGAVVIGRVVNKPVYTIMSRGKKVCELPIHAITTEVRALRKAIPRDIDRDAPNVSVCLDKNAFKPICLNLLSAHNNNSKRYIYRFYDNAVRGDTVLYPGEADSVLITPIKGCDAGLVVSIDSNLYGEVDPYTCGAAAVAEAVRNVIAVGGQPLAVTDCLNYGNPEKPDVFFDFEQGVKGISDACHAFSFIENEALPVISGNVSFYNESKQGNAVIPSPVLLVVGKVEDYHSVVTMQIKHPEQHLFLIGRRYPEFGAAQISELIPDLNKVAPQVRFEKEAEMNKAVFQLTQNRLVSACHDISSGGLWSCLCEMLFGERGLIHVGLDLRCPEDNELFTFLFAENAGYVISVSEENVKDVNGVLSQYGFYHSFIGKTIANKQMMIKRSNIGTLNLELAELEQAWNKRNQE
ncbi:phosphoribosylformylglycinamidine synthase subunit PurL [Thermoproteota archaeon]